MSDTPTPRRRSQDYRPLGERVSSLEADMSNLARQWDAHLIASDRTHRDLTSLIETAEDREHRRDLSNARLMGGVGVLVFIGSMLGPLVADFLTSALAVVRP